MRVAVIIPAAGVGKRFNQALDTTARDSSRTKVELEISGKPVFIHSIELFTQRPEVEQIILAVNPDGVDSFKFKYADRLGMLGVKVIAGGTRERWETVMLALKHVGAEMTHVAVHDAARPLTSQPLIGRVLDAAARYPAVIPGYGVPATLKRAVVVEETDAARGIDPADAILGAAEPLAGPVKVRRVTATIDRTDVFEVQTPQVFESSLLRRAYQQISDGKLSGKGITDDAGLVEALGEPVHLVEGEPTNLKVTLPSDLSLAELILKSRLPKDPFEKPKRKPLFDDDDDE